MYKRVAIAYNEPYPSRYDKVGEERAVLGVLDTVTTVHQALLELSYDVTRFPLAPPLKSTERRLSSLDVDLVFNLFEGFCGQPETEAIVPEALSELGIPCTGCPGAVLRLALDKAKIKVLLKAAGIPTPDFQLINPQIMHMFRLGYPCIVKPRSEDASHGLSETSVVTDLASLEKQVRLISVSYDGCAIVEKFIDGREFNATVLGNSRTTVLPASEIVYSLPHEKPRILTFAAKWEPDSQYYKETQVVCPAQISDEEHKLIDETALAAFQLLGCQGYARVDMRMDKAGRLNVIEVNPNSDISSDAGAARQAKAAGMNYTQFIDKIVQLALEKQTYGNQNSPHVKKRQASPDANTERYARVQAI